MMRKFFPPFFWHSPKKKNPTDDARGHDALNFLSSRQAIEDVATFVKAMNAKYSLTRTKHEHSEKREHFFLIFFAKREHFIFQPFKFQEKHLPTFKFQGIFVSSQGTILLLVPPGIFGLLGVAAIQGCLRVGSGPSVGCSPLRNKLRETNG